MVKWKFRSCPRCNGDIFVDKDLRGWFEQCLQCSYARDLGSTTKLEQQKAWIEKEKERRAKTLNTG